MGLHAAGAAERLMSEEAIEELVLAEMEKHPSRRVGPRAIKSEIARTTGNHLRL